jgi:hypothetical protein
MTHFVTMKRTPEQRRAIQEQINAERTERRRAQEARKAEKERHQQPREGSEG